MSGQASWRVMHRCRSTSCTVSRILDTITCRERDDSKYQTEYAPRAAEANPHGKTAAETDQSPRAADLRAEMR
jgi:hypothetical protein